MASIDSYYKEIIEEIQRKDDEELRKMMPDIRQNIDGHREYLDRERAGWEDVRGSCGKNQNIKKR